MVWDLFTNTITLDQIPDLLSFIVTRKEYFGGYLFSPYQQEPITLNEIGFYIVELCNGNNTVSEIISLTADKFSLPTEFIDAIVMDTLQNLNRYFAIRWLEEKLSKPRNEIQVLPKQDDKDILSAPLLVLWDITYRCNLKCKHCLVSSNEQNYDELSLIEVKKIIDQLAEMKVFNIYFLGGEPLVRKDFLEILEYATHKKIGVSFSTNGVLVDDQLIAKLAEIKIFGVQVSLDGLKETHNKIRGLKSVYQNAKQAIKKLIESGINVSVSMTVSKINLHEIKPLIKEMISLGVAAFKAIPFLPVGRGKESIALMLSHVEMKEYAKSLVKYKEEFKDKIQISAEQTYNWLVDGTIPESFSTKDQAVNFSCSAGSQSIVISPTGLVFPCHFLHGFIAGDLRKETLREIWFNSEELGKFRNINRNRLKGKCKDCNFIPKYCRGGCRAAAYILTGDFYAEDPLCWFEPES